MRRHLSTLLKIGVTLIGLALVLTQFDLKAIGALLRSAEWPWLLAGFLLINASVVLRAYRWFLLVRGLAPSIRFGRLVELYFVGNFFNTFLPSGFGGDVVRILEVSRDIPTSVATGTVLLDRMTGLLMLFALGLLGLPFAPPDFPPTLKLIILVLCLGGLAAGMIVLYARLLRRYGRWLPGKLSTEGDGFVAQVVSAVEECGWRAIGGAMGISVLFNGLQIAWWWTTARALSLNVSFTYLLLVVPLLSLAMLVPSIGGLGVREVLAPMLFAGAGLTSEEAVALSLLVFILERLSGLLGGPVYIWTTLRDRSRPRSSNAPNQL